jgi:hypothetical protein
LKWFYLPNNHVCLITDDNLNLDCLAATISMESKYISVFPVDCKAKVADSIKCIMPYEDIMTYSATFDGKIHLLAMLLIANLL